VRNARDRCDRLVVARASRAIVPSRGLNGGDSRKTQAFAVDSRKTQAFAVGGKTPWPIDQPAPSREADALEEGRPEAPGSGPVTAARWLVLAM
jgi:hypothetical protein